MAMEELILQAIQKLPLEKKQEVLDFAEFLGKPKPAKRPRPHIKGLWKDQNVHISEEDIAEVRREMWANFPREDLS